MKRFMTVILLLILTTVMLPSKILNAGALMEEVDFNAGTDVYSKYIWRGQNLVDNWVAQPTVGASFKGVSVSFWCNYDIDGGEWTEADLTLDYTAGLGAINESLEKLSVSIGYIYYTFPNLDHDDTSQEIYAGLGLDIILSPSLTVYYDWDTGDGAYIEGGISHTYELEYFDVTPSAVIGYNDGQWGYDSSFSNALLSLNVSKTLGEYFTIGATIAESIALDDQYDSEFYGGVNLSASF